MVAGAEVAGALVAGAEVAGLLVVGGADVVVVGGAAVVVVVVGGVVVVLPPLLQAAINGTRIRTNAIDNQIFFFIFSSILIYFLT